MPQTKLIINSLIVDIWTSFLALPAWVRIWMLLVLAPINMASLFFLDQPMGGWITVLALGGMFPNLGIVVYERGLSRLTAILHIIPWTLLVGLLLFARPESSGIYDGYLWGLLVCDIVSLIFDYPDALKWIKGQRKVVGR